MEFSDIFVSQRVCFTPVLSLEVYYVKTDGKIIGKINILRR